MGKIVIVFGSDVLSYAHVTGLSEALVCTDDARLALDRIVFQFVKVNRAKSRLRLVATFVRTNSVERDNRLPTNNNRPTRIRFSFQVDYFNRRLLKR